MLEKGSVVFGHWTVDEKIGAGAYGTVYKLKRNEFGTEYQSALKVISIPPENTDSSGLQSEGMTNEEISEYYADIAKSFMEEIKLLEELKGNSNVVSYEDHIIDKSEDGLSYTILIRMELLTPLKKRLQEQIFDKKEVCRLGIDICSALELCEKRKIIHRDIKPDNIFISNSDTYKLGDFGVARTMEKTVAAMSQKGTYTYMAPEIFVGKEYNQNVDLYSLGILLYQLLNKNRTPFLPEAPQTIKFSDREEAQKKRMSGEMLPEIKGLSKVWNEFLLTACHPDPEKRFQNASQMKAVLEKLMAEKDVTVAVEQEAAAASKPAPVSEKPIEQAKSVVSDTIKAPEASTDKKSEAVKQEKIVKTKEKKKDNKKDKVKAPKSTEYLNWLMNETTSKKYTVYFLLMTILNSFAASCLSEYFLGYDAMLLIGFLVVPALFVVKALNFILALCGKKAFLKRIPLYIITFFLNFFFMGMFSPTGDVYGRSGFEEIVMFVVGAVSTVIPVIISCFCKPGRKVVGILTRISTYISTAFYAFMSMIFVSWIVYDCWETSLNYVIAVILIAALVASSIAYPIIINRLTKKEN
ncbi:MAG: serine/threonine-protein kinase [Clostridia bacterium]|nr:serine/threonine-protein kinase [Clostridia bacterium]